MSVQLFHNYVIWQPLFLLWTIWHTSMETISAMTSPVSHYITCEEETWTIRSLVDINCRK